MSTDIFDSYTGVDTPRSEWSMEEPHSRSSSFAFPINPIGRSHRDPESDSSHYSDEEENYPAVPRVNDVFTNAPDSPDVPRRISSVHHQRNSSLGIDQKELNALVSSGRISSDSNKPPSPSKSAQRMTKEGSRGSGEGKIEYPSSLLPKKEKSSVKKEEELEMAMSQAADREDPNRPKTLKEARALAKERARMRKEMQQSEDLGGPNADGPAKSTSRPVKSTHKRKGEGGISADTALETSLEDASAADIFTKTLAANASFHDRPRRDPKREPGKERESFQSDRSMSAFSHEDSGAPTSWQRYSQDQSQDPFSVLQEAGHSRQRARAEPDASEDTTRDDLVDQRTDEAHPDLRRYGQASSSLNNADDTMNELQAAVGDALEDLSFGSSTATGSTAVPPSTVAVVGPSSSLRNAQGHEPQAKTSVLETDSASSAQSATSFDSAQESPTFSSGAVYPRSSTMGDTLHQQAEDPINTSIPSSSSQPTFTHHAATPSNISANTTATKTTMTSPSSASTTTAPAPISKFVPHEMTIQQRAMGPNKVARLDIYGKTVPWPASFNAAAVADQTRLAPWERARGYAHYCNELARTSSGLEVWLEIVQRPAQKTPQEQHKKGHVRGEGTDASGYATSVRSDATFPVRGDGGKAKDITHIQAIPESPPSALPSNIPYPMLVNPSRSNSTINEESPHASHMPSTRSSGSISGAKGAAGSFFSSLGRRGSTRRTPGVGSSGISGMSSLATVAGGNAGALRGPKSRNKTISSPMISSPASSSNIAAIASATSASLKDQEVHVIKSQHKPSQSLPQQPAELNVTVGADPIISSPIQSPVLQSPHESSKQSFSRGEGTQVPTPTSTTSVRAPMGPRAPSHANSNASFLTAPSRRDSAGSIGLADQKGQYYGLSPSGGIYGVPQGQTSKASLRHSPSNSNSPLPPNSPTDYSAEGGGSVSSRASPKMGSSPLPHGKPISSPNAAASVKSSFSYGTVRDREKGSPSLTSPNERSSERSSPSFAGSTPSVGAPRGSFTNAKSPSPSGTMSEQEKEALEKLADVLPDADRGTLVEYLRKAQGNDLVAIGDYLQDQALGKIGASSKDNPPLKNGRW